MRQDLIDRVRERALALALPVAALVEVYLWVGLEKLQPETVERLANERVDLRVGPRVGPRRPRKPRAPRGIRADLLRALRHLSRNSGPDWFDVYEVVEVAKHAHHLSRASGQLIALARLGLVEDGGRGVDRYGNRDRMVWRLPEAERAKIAAEQAKLAGGAP